jgi:hypothetical protein
MRVDQEDTQAFKDEMRLYREDTQVFKDEIRADRREMNRKWGNLANKLGPMVEDLVYPSLPRVIKETLGQEADRIAIRVKQRGPDGRRKEFDALALTTDLVVLNGTRATLRSADVDAFVAEIGGFGDYFPEYGALPLVGILAALAVEEGVLSYAEKQGFLVLAVGDEVMEVKNHPGFQPKRW